MLSWLGGWLLQGRGVTAERGCLRCGAWAARRWGWARARGGWAATAALAPADPPAPARAPARPPQTLLGGSSHDFIRELFKAEGGDESPTEASAADKKKTGLRAFKFNSVRRAAPRAGLAALLRRAAAALPGCCGASKGCCCLAALGQARAAAQARLPGAARLAAWRLQPAGGAKHSSQAGEQRRPGQLGQRAVLSTAALLPPQPPPPCRWPPSSRSSWLS